MSEPELASLLDRHSVPGAALGVVRGDEAVIEYCGVADVETGEAVTPETRFAVGSLCKSMVATAVARLVDAHRLSFEDMVAGHVPELRGAAWAERASIEDLLANRSRLPLLAEVEFADDGDSLAGLVARLATSEPGPAVWSYSNAGWCVLGHVLETVTGIDWEDAMRAELLDPLAMHETTFVTDGVDVPHAVGHEVTAEGVVRAKPWSPPALGPAGSTMRATLTDVLRLARAHLEQPGLAALRTTTAEVRIAGWLDGWGLGWARFDWEGGPVWGWDGLISGQRAFLRLVPEQRGAAVLLTNADSGRAFYRALFPRVMEEWFGVRMPPLRLEPSVGAAGDLSRYAGAYAWPDRRWDITARDDGLVLTQDDRTLEASPIDARTFLVDAGNPDTPTVTFGAFDDDDRPRVLYELVWGFPRC
jgi:CubicO group peptidase (beta-lactamase class C family)